MAKSAVRSFLTHALGISSAFVLSTTSILGQSKEPEGAPVTAPAANAPGGWTDPRPAGATTSIPRAPIAATHEEHPTAVAVRTQSAITVDGRLDEPVWMTAAPVTDFWQIDPEEGAPISERTEVRFLYDDDALYIACWLWDTDATIVTRLSRRDTAIGDIDLFSVHLDTYHSHRSSYRFTVSALGTIRDLAAGPGLPLTGGDVSWNPVWDVKTRITDQGWFLEMRIPFSQLRFSREDEQVWGLQIERKVRPQQENTIWSFTRKTDPNGQQNFGHLVGIRGIRTGSRLEVLPYAGGSAEFIRQAQRPEVQFQNPFRSGSDFFGNAGLDMKYKITSNLTFDGTANPDFGQVEVDPAVINLTAFETRFQEKRPFFIEGAEIFNFGEDAAQILYSRRIGRPPHGSAPSSAIYTLTPTATTILGAGKLTGKTVSGWSVAFLDAVAGREYSTWRDLQNVESSQEVEPLTNYLAGRARREMRQGQTTLGILATSVHRDLGGSPLEPSVLSSAYSAGIDFSHDFAKRVWHTSASFSPSYVQGSTGALIATQRLSSRYYQRPDADYLEVDSTATSLFGYAAYGNVEKQGGNFKVDLGGSVISPGYEVNDLGFQTVADRLGARLSMGYDQPKVGKVFRAWYVRAIPDLAWNYGGDLIGATVNLSSQVQLKNFSSVNVRFAVNPSKMNQRLTRGGPLARDPRGYSGELSYNTVGQAKVTVRSGIDFGWDESDAWSRRVNIGMQIRAGEHLDMNFGPSFSQSRSRAQYVTSVADATAAATLKRRYLFADLDQSTLSIDSRINFTISPRITLEIFAQPLISSGDYGDLKELAAPRTFDFNVFGTGGSTSTPLDGGRRYQIDPDGSGPAKSFTVNNTDFNTRSLRANAVFRWEWRPGSTLFVVWQHNRAGTITGADPVTGQSTVGNFQVERDVGDLLDLHGDNIFMFKLAYWLNP